MKGCYIDFTTIYEIYASILFFNVFVLNLSSGVWDLCAAVWICWGGFYGTVDDSVLLLLMKLNLIRIWIPLIN